MVAAKLNVRWYEIRDVRIGPTEHYVFACRLQIVIDDLERARAVPPGYGLRIEAEAVTAGYVGVDYRRISAVKSDAARYVSCRIAMNITSVDNEIVRRQRQAGLTGIAESYYAVVGSDCCSDSYFKPDKPVIVCAGCGSKRRRCVRRNHPGHRSRLARRDPCAFDRNARQV